MTPENSLLENLSEWRTAEPGSRVVALPGSPWTVTLTADRCDELGAKLREIAVRRADAPAGVTVADWAARVCAGAKGLLETLRVYEVDQPRQTALLRSTAPTERGEKLFYYEAALTGTTAATFRRYQAQNGHGKREQVPFVLTHETLASTVLALTADE